MSRIIEGVLDFQKRIFGTKESLFRKLGKGQQPLALFITCSDSRINPNLLTQTEPGELFILRNAGNLVPPHGSPANGEQATIEYAVVQLQVRDIILCGHYKCGAMHALLEPHHLDKLPQVAAWLKFAEAVRPRVEQAGAGLSLEQRLNLTVEQNVVQQLDHLRSHPPVAEAVAAGRLRLHAWAYDFESGTVMALDPVQNRFVCLSRANRPRFAVSIDEAQAAPRSEYETSI